MTFFDHLSSIETREEMEIALMYEWDNVREKIAQMVENVSYPLTASSGHVFNLPSGYADYLRERARAEADDLLGAFDEETEQGGIGKTTLAKLRDSKLFEEDEDDADAAPVILIPRESDMDMIIRLNAEVQALRAELSTLRGIINTASDALPDAVFTTVMCPSAGWVEFYAGFVDPAHDTGLHIWAAGDLASMAKIYLKWQDEVERGEHRQRG